jgi:hypothetical protein
VVIGGASRLEYAYAFDLAAAWLHGLSPLLAVVSSPEFVDQVVVRAAGGVVFACADHQTYDHACWRLAGGSVPEEVARQSDVLASLDRCPADGTLAGGIWAAPQPATWRPALGAIGRALARPGRLCVVTGTPLSRLTRIWRAQRHGGDPSPLAPALVVALAAGGWEVGCSQGLGGLPSLGWALAARAAGAAGRPDLADRAERAHHRAITDPTGASYAVVLATRGGPA